MMDLHCFRVLAYMYPCPKEFESVFARCLQDSYIGNSLKPLPRYHETLAKQSFDHLGLMRAQIETFE